MNSVCGTCAYVYVVHYALGSRLKTLMQIEYVHTNSIKYFYFVVGLRICWFDLKTLFEHRISWWTIWQIVSGRWIRKFYGNWLSDLSADHNYLVTNEDFTIKLISFSKQDESSVRSFISFILTTRFSIRNKESVKMK